MGSWKLIIAEKQALRDIAMKINLSKIPERFSTDGKLDLDKVNMVLKKYSKKGDHILCKSN